MINHPSHSHSSLIGWLLQYRFRWCLLVIAPVFWGGNFVFGRYVSPDVPADVLNLLRWGVAALVLLPIGAGRLVHERRQVFGDRYKLAVLSLLGVVGFNTTLYLALQEFTASQVAIGFSLTPVLILVIAAAIDRRVPRPRILIATGISFLGVYLAFQQSLVGLSVPESLALAQRMSPPVIIWSLYCIALKRFALNVSPLTGFLVQILIGMIVLSVFVGFRSKPMDVVPELSFELILAVLYLGIFAAAVAFLCWQLALRHASAGEAGVAMNLAPLTSLLLAWVFLGEALSGREALGTALIFTGLVVAGMFEALRLKPTLASAEVNLNIDERVALLEAQTQEHAAQIDGLVRVNSELVASQQSIDKQNALTERLRHFADRHHDRARASQDPNQKSYLEAKGELLSTISGEATNLGQQMRADDLHQAKK
ncbi:MULTISPECIES: DMT family transporter [unclassified Ruegeria]|uniref:DMT family transporter n=1 Tax=unclassified Ruegeria TaxID=2625375 RepID=UPI0014883AA4|nr:MULTISPECIES: DMT family transporter [unclassified Ruegeria]